jgi:hypothetical protein
LAKLAVLEPSPDPKFLEAPDNNSEPELVTHSSAKCRHKGNSAVEALDDAS